MKKIKFDVPIYDWSILCLRIDGKEDADGYAKEVKKFGFKNPEDYGIDMDNVADDVYDGGACTYSSGERKELITIYRCSSKKDLLNVILHECDHAVWNIMKWGQIKDKEARAYLSAFIGHKLLEDLL